jgi:hypothetical protein
MLGLSFRKKSKLDGRVNYCPASIASVSRQGLLLRLMIRPAYLATSSTSLSMLFFHCLALLRSALALGGLLRLKASRYQKIVFNRPGPWFE